MTMTKNAIPARPGLATTQGICEIFSGHQTELEWLAYFITGDELMATACVADACNLSVSRSQVFEEYLLNWARYATVRSAILMLGSGITQLSPKYERQMCGHRGHPPLNSSDVQVALEEARVITSRLDALSRCALVMCGIEKRSSREAAVIMGVGRSTVELAYCSAIECLEAIRRERVKEEQPELAVCNRAFELRMPGERRA